MELKKTLNAYKTLNKLKDDFLNLIIHELRSPVTILKSSLDTLDYVANSNFDINAMKEFVSISSEEVDKLHKLIEKIILLQKLKLKQYDIKPEDIYVKSFIEGIITENNEWNTKNVNIVIDIPNDMIITFDKTLLEYMFGNLIENAIKYNKNHGELRISVIYSGILLFEDTGIGLSKEEMLYIFDEFRQVIDVEHHSSGLGLGLAIVKYICKLTNTLIELESEEGVGTKVFLIFI